MEIEKEKELAMLLRYSGLKDRFNIFGMNLTLKRPNKEENNFINAVLQERELRDSDGGELIRPEDIAFCNKEIEYRKEHIENLSKKIKHSDLNILLSFYMLAFVFILGFKFYLIFSIPMLFFFIKRENLQGSYKSYSSMLAFAIFFRDEIGTSLYNESYQIKLPFDLNKKAST